MADHLLSRPALRRALFSLLADELIALRQLDRFSVADLPWQESTHITPAPADAANQASLHADSMELIALATRVTTFFQLDRSGIEDYLLRRRSLGDWLELIEASRTDHPGLRFQTSGSTGKPSICEHHWDDLVGEVSHLGEHFEALLGCPIRRVIAPIPAHHIYGFLFSVLLPDVLGLPVIDGTRALSLAHSRELETGDLCVAVPLIWQQLARTGQAFPPEVLGLTSTGPCDPNIIDQLLQQGLSAMIELYGSSETAGIGVRNRTDQPFQLLPRWRSAPDEDALIAHSDGRRFALADRLQWCDERHLYPLGRKDKAIQVGGSNVYPDHIASRLAQLAGVVEAQVRPMSHQARLKAFIVPAKDQDPHLLKTRLEQWCQQHLTVAERPRSFTFGDQLPTSDLGKASDWSVAGD